MSKELATPEPKELAQPANMLEVLARAVADPRVDVAKMQALLDMQMQIRKEDARLAFNEAMARLQPTMPRITKNGRIAVSGTVRSKYAKFEDIDLEIRPLYAAEGFSISWNTEQVGGAVSVHGLLRHSAGHNEPYQITLPRDDSGSKNGVQGVGSTLSYGKRYLLCSMFNIITVDEDNDGAADTVSEDQVRQIEDYFQSLGMDDRAKRTFIGFMEVKDLKDLTQQGFRVAINWLRAKEQRR